MSIYEDLFVVYYESIKREVKRRLIYEYRFIIIVVYYKSRKRELKAKLMNESVR